MDQTQKEEALRLFNTGKYSYAEIGRRVNAKYPAVNGFIKRAVKSRSKPQQQTHEISSDEKQELIFLRGFYVRHLKH